MKDVVFVLCEEVFFLKEAVNKIIKYFMRVNLSSIDSIITIIGIVMIGRGLWLIYPPVMWIGIGLILAFPWEIINKIINK